MKFRDVKRKIIHCLQHGDIEFAARGHIDLKNLLVTGDVTPEDVIAVISRAGGNDYQRCAHHFDPSIEVHIIIVAYARLNWYIKWYFDEPVSIFISVHH